MSSECNHDTIDTPFCPICGESVGSDHVAELQKLRRKYRAFMDGKIGEWSRCLSQLALPLEQRPHNTPDHWLHRQCDSAYKAYDTAERKLNAIDAAIQALTNEKPPPSPKT